MEEMDYNFENKLDNIANAFYRNCHFPMSMNS